MKSIVKLPLMLLPVFALLAAGHAAENGKFDGATPLEWSERVARAQMARYGNSLDAGASPAARWDYSPAVFALALVKLGEATKRPEYGDFAAHAVGSFVRPDGSILTYKVEDYSLDQINPGKVLFPLAAAGKDDRFAKALTLLRAQLATQPRTSEGGFWHKKRYPHQMWLDGVYMATPFLAEYAAERHEPALFADAARQILLIDRHLYDPATGLYWHAWDEAHAQSWANPQTGLSPNFWSRAIGWYGMAIVDALDYFPVSEPDIDGIVAALQHVADGAARWQDPRTGLWWQVTNLGGRPGNYLEASGSAMFVYTLAKAVNRGYLPREKYLPVILKGYAGLVHDLVRPDAHGAPSLTQICQGAGLGYTSANGRPRDGSFDYYISEPVVADDPKGVGPFVLAGIEVNQLLAGGSAPSRITGWDQVPALLERIKAPVFPARDFPIADFGARPGMDATPAIAAAIKACHGAGGGRVLVPAGEWLTGAVRLLSNVDLHLAKGAVLRFSTDPAAYPNVATRWEGVECINYSPFIYAYDEENVAVTGEGTLDGQASDENWWRWARRGADHRAPATADRDQLNDLGEKGVPVEQRVFGPGHYLRPAFIEPYRCRNVLIEGVTILRSPMWELHPTLCTNVTVRGVNINSLGPNNDGCDPESCTDVLIDDCTFRTGDDCIAIKSGRNNDGRRVGVPSANLVIRHCRMLDGHGGVVVGSEVSGGCRNVFAEDCTMDSPQLDRALRLKSNARRGGTIENVFLRNIRVGQVVEAILTVDLQYEEGARGEHPPVVRNIRLEHVTADSCPRLLWIAGFPAATIEGIRLQDCAFHRVKSADVVDQAGRIEFERVAIEPADRKPSRNSRPADPVQP